MSKYSLSALKAELTPEELEVIKKTYWHNEKSGMMFTYSRFMGVPMAYAMYPMIDWLYQDKTKEEKSEALLRQGKFWNCEAVMHSLAVGIIASMEKDHAVTGNTTEETIEAIKTALIGPLSAIGDTLFWIVWRIMVTGIALTMSLQGSIMGPIFFIVVYNAPKYFLRWYLLLLGYSAGSNLLSSMGESGLMEKITRAAGILGNFMIGAMVPMLVSVPMILTFSMNGLEQPVVDIFNGIFPGALEMLVVFIMLWAVKKKPKPVMIVLITFAISILGAAIGVF